MSQVPWRPTKAQLEAARNKTLPDLIRPNLNILFIGINPGLYTAAIGRHFGRPGNRFWPSLSASGLLRTPLTAWDSDQLLENNIGITNLVPRATTLASELTVEELKGGLILLKKKILRYKPKKAAFLGVGPYRQAFDLPKAAIGLQKETIGSTQLWVFPNPSGLNAHFQVPDYARLFRQLR